MPTTSEEWNQLKADLGANWDIIVPDALNDALVGGISNLAQAKPILTGLVMVVWAMCVTDAIDKSFQTQKNLITNRIYTAKETYQNANPEFDPDTWTDYSNAEMFSMIATYDPTIETDYYFVYNTLQGLQRDSKDKIHNLLKKVVDAVPL